MTCATSLFQHGVDEKLIRERTGHRSNALFVDEKGSVEQQEEVPSVLGPVKSSEKSTSVATSEKLLQNFRSDVDERVNSQHSVFNDCNITFNLL